MAISSVLLLVPVQKNRSLSAAAREHDALAGAHVVAQAYAEGTTLLMFAFGAKLACPKSQSPHEGGLWRKGSLTMTLRLLGAFALRGQPTSSLVLNSAYKCQSPTRGLWYL